MLGAAVALFVWNRLPVAVVAIAAALALHAAGVIDVEQAVRRASAMNCRGLET